MLDKISPGSDDTKAGLTAATIWLLLGSRLMKVRLGILLS